MEKPGETCTSSPHPSSSKPPPAPEAKFSRRSGSPAIRTPSICSSLPAWQPTGRSSAALLLAPRRDCRGSRIHLQGGRTCTFVCGSASSKSAPRRGGSLHPQRIRARRPSSTRSWESAISSAPGKGQGARKENRGRRRIQKGHACAATAAASPLSSSSASSTSAPSRRRPSSSHLPHTRHPPSARGRESATAPAPSRGRGMSRVMRRRLWRLCSSSEAC